MEWAYTPHHREAPMGHLYLGEVPGAVTITLTPAASMTQQQLDRYGNYIVAAVRAATVLDALLTQLDEHGGCTEHDMSDPDCGWAAFVQGWMLQERLQGLERQILADRTTRQL